MLAAVAFDFGNVLCRFSHQQACDQIARLATRDATPAHVRQYIYTEQRMDQLEDGRLHPEQFLAGLGERFGVTDPGTLRHAYRTIFQRVEPTCELIARVRLPKLLASNTDPLHWEEISVLFGPDLARFTPNGLVRSYDVGIRKPDPGFFTGLLHRARQELARPTLTAGELLFVDDMPENCEAARACGLHVHCHLNHDTAALAAVLDRHGALG